MTTHTKRSILVQKAKKLGIKNISKKNMTILKKEIAQEQSKTIQQKSKTIQQKVVLELLKNNTYTAVNIIDDLIAKKGKTDVVCILQMIFEDKFYPCEFSIKKLNDGIQDFIEFYNTYNLDSTDIGESYFFYWPEKEMLSLMFYREIDGSEGNSKYEFTIYGISKTKITSIKKKIDIKMEKIKDFPSLYKGGIWK